MVVLHDDRPVEHRMLLVYRIGAGLIGLFLLVFGILGFLDQLAFFSTTGERVIGLSSNGLLSLLSVIVGVILVAAAAVGGIIASNVMLVLGVLFVLSGFVNLAWLDTSANFLAFHMANVIFSFIVGLVLATMGGYGRFSSHLSPENPYWRKRHPNEMDRHHAGPPPPRSAGTPRSRRPPREVPAGRRAAPTLAGRPARRPIQVRQVTAPRSEQELSTRKLARRRRSSRTASTLLGRRAHNRPD